MKNDKETKELLTEKLSHAIDDAIKAVETQMDELDEYQSIQKKNRETAWRITFSIAAIMVIIGVIVYG